MEYYDFVGEKLQAAAAIAVKNFGVVTASIKPEDNNQVVTQTDIDIGRFLVSEIKSAFPTHNIIDEETGVVDKQSNYTWVIDPIDGTSNFANGVPTFGTMLGLLEDNRPIAGGLSLPVFSEYYLAETGKGCWLNGQRLQVTAEPEVGNCLIAYGIDSHREDPKKTEQECAALGKIVLAIRNLRSSNSVFDVAMVLKGSYGGILNQTSKIWDNVAQHILIQEAGGIYTDFWGESIDYTNPIADPQKNFTFCAASPVLHTQLIELVNQ